MRNQLAKLCNAVSAPVSLTREALAERLQSLRKTVSILYNRMMENMEYGRQILKDIGEKEAREEEAEEEQQQDDEEYDTLPSINKFGAQRKTHERIPGELKI